MQRELPVDFLEFTMLTPLPGSEDHKRLYDHNIWMESDLNAYDLESVTVAHPKMSHEEWRHVYFDAWDRYYTDEHVERLMRRNKAYGAKTVRIWRGVAQVYGAANFEGLHPQQCGYFRRKVRTERRPELPREPALRFYPAHIAATLVKYARFVAYGFKTHRIRKRVEKDPMSKFYSDLAIAPVVDAEGKSLEMFSLSPAARTAVEKARRQARNRAAGGVATAAPELTADGGQTKRAASAKRLSKWRRSRGEAQRE